MPTYRPAGESDEDSDVSDEYYISSNDYKKKSFDPVIAQTESDNLMGHDIRDFHMSVLNSDFAQITDFISLYGFSVDTTFADGLTPMLIACHQGNIDLVRFLSLKGAVLSYSSGYTALMAVCADNSLAPNCSASGMIYCAHYLLFEKLVDINVSDNYKMTALMFAAKHGHFEIVKLFLDTANDTNLQIDACDSQKWTALCFAADHKYGDIVRILLDAGANPDVTTSDGVKAIDIAAHDVAIYNLMQIYSQKKLQICREDSLMITNRSKLVNIKDHYSILDNVLMGMDLFDYIPLFQQHKIDITQFLQLNESDINDLNIEEIGVRKRLLDGILEMNRQEWKRSSLPVITPLDKSHGIYLSCPDAVAIMVNLVEHIKYIGSNIDFLRRRIEAKPEMLQIGQDVEDVLSLDIQAMNCLVALDLCRKKSRELCSLLNDGTIDRRHLKPVDVIQEESSGGIGFLSYMMIKIGLSFVILGSISIVAFRSVRIDY